MKSAPFTERQAGHARLAEALRELSPFIVNVELDRVAGTPIIWPADNIRAVLNDAADLIDELTIKAG
jgi:hypothetical protein